MGAAIAELWRLGVPPVDLPEPGSVAGPGLKPRRRMSWQDSRIPVAAPLLRVGKRVDFPAQLLIIPQGE